MRKEDVMLVKKLVSDCICYNLTTDESLKYIANMYKPISLPSYYKYRQFLLDEPSTQEWLNQFTRIGFVQHHRKQIDHALKIQEDSMHRFYEMIANRDQYDDDKVLKLKHDIRENIKLLTDLGLGTPIVAAIKAKIQLQEKKMQKEETRDLEVELSVDNQEDASGVSESS